LQYVAKDFASSGGQVTSGFEKDPLEPCRHYSEQLTSWAQSSCGHPKLNAIRAYVDGGHVIGDLVNAGILPLDESGFLVHEWEGDKRDAPEVFAVIDDPCSSFVRWRVEVPNDPVSGTWQDAELVGAWQKYYEGLRTKRGLCLVTGEETLLADQHPAKLRHAADKAKLISSNDLTGYTFRGRMSQADEACSVGFDVTQKAHNALRWLIARQGYRSDSQAVIAWAVRGKPLPDPIWNSRELFLEAEELLANDLDQEVGDPVAVGDIGQTFARQLNRRISGYGAALAPTDEIVVMALDSATPGRMAITFYRELQGSEFLDRVLAWHQAYAWCQNFGKEQGTRKALLFTGAPSPVDIAEAAFGRRLDAKLKRSTVERLLPCIIDGRQLPRDIVEAAVRRTRNRSGLERWEWEKYLGIACGLFKGHFRERGYAMTLEVDRASRDYLYGRLLAIAEHIESRALHVAGETRDTNAARFMQRFADRPFSTWRAIETALTPSKARLRNRRPGFLRKMEAALDGVMSTFAPDDFLNDRRLSGEFLLGYHCQRQALQWSAASEPTTDNNDTEEE
jgi:CRISPR-associated protein Csd1